MNGRATVTTTLAEGRYVFSAVYSGQERYARSESDTVAHTIDDGPKPRRRSARH